MTRTAMRNHLLVVGGVLLALALLGTHLGLNNGTWWLLAAVAVVLHMGVFTALITWVVSRVRGHRAPAEDHRADDDGAQKNEAER